MSKKLIILYTLFFICFVALIIIIVMNFDSSPVGEAISVQGLNGKFSYVELFGILLILFAGSIMVIFMSSQNPHAESELKSFHVHKPSTKEDLEYYMKFSKIHHKEFAHVKDVLVKHGWNPRDVREIGDKLNQG